MSRAMLLSDVATMPRKPIISIWPIFSSSVGRDGVCAPTAVAPSRRSERSSGRMVGWLGVAGNSGG